MRVQGRVRRRSLGYGSFADITNVPVAWNGITRTYIDFDGDLSPAEVTQVWERMTSEDDEDQACRALVAAALEAHGDDCPLGAAVARYLLGACE